MNTFTRSLELLHSALDVNSLRYNVSANNIANSGVPNYKRSSVNFESALKRALEESEDERLSLTRTHEKHFSLDKDRNVKARVVTDYLSSSKANGNNVDAEAEAGIILETQMQYRLLSMLTNFEFSQVETAIRRG